MPAIAPPTRAAFLRFIYGVSLYKDMSHTPAGSCAKNIICETVHYPA